MDQIFRRNPKATERSIGSAVFLANPDEGTLYRLNETVAALWRLLEEPVSLREAIRTFCEAFPEEDPERIASEVAIMIDDLGEEGLIEIVDP